MLKHSEKFSVGNLVEYKKTLTFATFSLGNKININKPIGNRTSVKLRLHI